MLLCNIYLGVTGTKVHIIYALKMGKKYEKRYRKHFKNPDIIRFNMQHEAWMFEKNGVSRLWKQSISAWQV